MPLLFTKPSLFGRATAVLRDHVALTADLDQLRALADHLTEKRSTPAVDVLSLLEGFVSEARAHFDAEESNGYFGTLVADSPELGERIARLEGDHAEMLATMDRLLNFARNEPSDPVFGPELRRFVDRFQAHERAENAILQEFFLRDAGGSG